MSRVRVPLPTPQKTGLGNIPIPFQLPHTGVSPSGKATAFDAVSRWFESSHPCQCQFFRLSEFSYSICPSSSVGTPSAEGVQASNRAAALGELQSTAPAPAGEHKPTFAPVAQSAEHLPFKQGVRGSNPRWSTKKIASLLGCYLFASKGIRKGRPSKHAGGMFAGPWLFRRKANPRWSTNIFEVISQEIASIFLFSELFSQLHLAKAF